MSRFVRRGLFAACAVAVAVTVLPLLPSDQSWIRIWDFPRIQIAVMLVALLVALPVAADVRRPVTAGFLLAAAGALAWQAYGIWPYTPLSRSEVVAKPSCADASRIGLLVANVLVDNHDEEPLLALIERIDPDVVLLVETDAWWDARLGPLIERYPHSVRHPRENGYGMHLYSRLELIDPRVRFLIEEDVPSVRTGIRLRSGVLIDFHGVHPKPPPRQDTAERDAELLLVGKETQSDDTPSMVAGDLNDVAWSETTELFREISGMLDPRIGRGLYATFNADWPLLRWPLDHVFFEESFALLEMSVLGDIGSDHFPLFVALCHDPQAARIQEEPEAEPSDVEEADEEIREGREEAAE